MSELLALLDLDVDDAAVRAMTSETIRLSPLEALWEKDPSPPTTAAELGQKRVHRWKLTLPSGLADVDAALTTVLGPPIPFREARRYGAFVVLPDGGDACTLAYYGYSLAQALDLTIVAVSPDATHVAVGDVSGRLRVFAPGSLDVSADVHLGFRLLALAWTPDGRKLLARVENREATHVFSADGAKHLATFERGQAPAELSALLATSDPPLTLAAYGDATAACVVRKKPVGVTVHPGGRIAMWTPGVPPTKLAELAFVDHLVLQRTVGAEWTRILGEQVDKTCAACGARVSVAPDPELGETCPACGHVAPDLAVAYPQLAIAKEVRPALLALPDRSPKALRCLAIANLFTDVDLAQEARWAIRASELDARAGNTAGAEAAERRADACWRAAKAADEVAVRLPPLEQVLPRLFDEAGPPPTVGAFEQAFGLALTDERLATNASGHIAFAETIGPDVTRLTLEYTLRRPITTLQELRARPLTSMSFDFRRGLDAFQAAVSGPGWTVTPLAPSGACRLVYVEPPRA